MIHTFISLRFEFCRQACITGEFILINYIEANAI